jgi:transcriptional regulator with XRE-family HTH domain
MVENTVKQTYDSETLLTGLSHVIKQKRKEKQLTQEDLSCDVGLARGYLSDVECGARNFSMKNLVKIANGLDVKPSELIYLAEEYMRRRKENEQQHATSLQQDRWTETSASASV